VKIPNLREFRDDPRATIADVVHYLGVEMTLNLKELVIGLRKLTFADNFESFQATVTIPAVTEMAIRNAIRGGDVPTKRIIVRGDTFSGSVVDGDTAWSKDFVYLKNTHATQPSTVTAVFLK
jgi:hypothetical protein